MSAAAIETPAYLAPPRPIDGRTFGRLVRSKSHWIISGGDPLAVSMAKRLFPGADGRDRGTVRFPASKRILGDLNWFLLRWPMEIEDAEAWEAARAETIEHATKSIDLRRRPQSINPPTAKFAGELKPFQAEGVAWMKHHQRTLLADEMGLGKTVQFLALLASANAYPCLVIVQPHLVRQWERAIERWLPGLAAHTLRGTTPQPILNWPIVLIHYGLIRHWKDELGGRFHTVCFDEIQELRHAGTQKYSAASHITDGVENVIGLSGTPIYNTGGEIWNVLNIIEMHCLGSKDHFTREWCHGYGSDTVIDPELLGRRLREEGLLLRRTKQDVLPELPAKRRIIESIEASAQTYGSIIGPALELAPQYAMTENVLEKGRLLREIVSYARKATGLAKVPYVGQFVRALLDAGESCLVFAHHHAVTDALMGEFQQHSPVRISGQETQSQKDDAVMAFQDGRTRVCIVSLRAAAGLDLFAAKCVVFAELDWSPAVHSQAEDRAHRIGQTDSVLAYYLAWFGYGSSDPEVLDKLGFKASQFIGLMGDRAESQEDRVLATKAAKAHMERIVEQLTQRRKDVAA